MGEAPTRAAKDFSWARRVGLSPAVMSRVGRCRGRHRSWRRARCDGGGDAAQSGLVTPGELLVEVADALGQLAQRESDHRGQGVVVGADPERRAGREQVRRVSGRSRARSSLRCGQDQGVELVQRLRAGLVPAALHDLQGAQRLDRPVVALRDRRWPPRSGRRGPRRSRRRRRSCRAGGGPAGWAGPPRSPDTPASVRCRARAAP